VNRSASRAIGPRFAKHIGPASAELSLCGAGNLRMFGTADATPRSLSMPDDAAKKALHRRRHINQLLTRYFEELRRSLTGSEEIFERALRQAQAAALVDLSWNAAG